MADPEYMRLYRSYAKALGALEIALEKRRRIRRQMGGRRTAPPPPRRPVGVRPGAVLREAPAAAPATPPPKPRPLRVDLGPILGMQEFVAKSGPPSGAPEPGLDIDTEALLDKVSLEQFRRAKADYESARRAFFDYVRRMRSRAFVTAGLEARRHLAAAKRHLEYAATEQLLGIDGSDPLEAARGEVAAFCAEIWDAYQAARESPVAQKGLVAAVAEAQLVDAVEVGVVPEMQREVDRLLDEAARGPATPGATPRRPKGSPRGRGR